MEIVKSQPKGAQFEALDDDVACMACAGGCSCVRTVSFRVGRGG